MARDGGCKAAEAGLVAIATAGAYASVGREPWMSRVPPSLTFYFCKMEKITVTS